MEENANNLDEKVTSWLRHSARTVTFGKSAVNRNMRKEKSIKKKKLVKIY